jgi:F-type H+-transporting ATPase subunit delta
VAGVSGRYATALFGLATDGGVVDAVAADLEDLNAAIEQNSDLQSLIRNPLLGRADQTRGIVAVAERAGFDLLTRNFLGLVASKRRLFFLSQMIRDFAKLVSAARGEVDAEVTTAVPLSSAQLSLVKEALTEAVGQEVKLRTTVDESLLGGLIAKVGSRMIDNSLRTKIQTLKVAMKEVG